MDLETLNLTEEQMASVQKLIQSETDKVRTDYSKKLKDVNNELAQYKPKEISEEEKALSDRIKALEDREKELMNKEAKIEIEKKLTDKGLPTSFSNFLKDDESIDAVSNYIFNSSTNIPSGHAKNAGISKSDYKQMSYSQRVKLMQTNPALYTALSK